MYKVYKNNRYLKSLGMFETYEKARQAVRKHIRKTIAPWVYETIKADCYLNGTWDSISRNPTNITVVGFKIKAV